MEERIYSESVIVSLKGIDEQICLRRYADGSISFDHSIEDAQKEVLSFMSSALKSGVNKLDFSISPTEYEVTFGASSVRRVHVYSPIYPSCAWFNLDSFEGFSLEDIAKFIKEYFESDCSKGVDSITFLPKRDHYGYIFKKNLIMKSSVEEIKNILFTTKLPGYTH